MLNTVHYDFLVLKGVIYDAIFHFMHQIRANFIFYGLLVSTMNLWREL